MGITISKKSYWTTLIYLFSALANIAPVSYTHLDVYKRQFLPMVAGHHLLHKTWRLTSWNCIFLRFFTHIITFYKEKISFRHIFRTENKDLTERM